MTSLDIGYLSLADPLDRRSWSGTLFRMYSALEKAGGVSLTPIGTSVRPTPPTLFERGLRKLGVSKRSLPFGNASLLDQSRERAGRIRDELARSRCEVLCAPVASFLLAYLETELPVVYVSDTTWRQVRSYYPENRKIPENESAELDELERLSIRRADRIIYPSAWAAESAVKDYGADRDKIRVIPYGANIEQAPSLESLPNRDFAGKCRLLFIGNRWHRKGGDIALDALTALQSLGVDATLSIISPDVPEGLTLPKGAEVVGYINKNEPKDRERFDELLFESHLLILPTRADCSPIVCCEAAAYGMPVIAPRTGGIPGLIEHEVTGLLVPEAAPGEVYAKAVAELMQKPELYRAMSRTSRERYEQKLNWPAWGREVKAVLAEARASRSPGARTSTATL